MQNKVVDFLKILMRPGAKLEMRALKLSNKQVVGQELVESTAEAEKFAIRYGRDAEVYMGVAPRFERLKYAPPRVLWVDVDFKSVPEDIVRSNLLLADPEPSIIVNSGGGLHLYWTLAEEIHGDPKPYLRWLVKQFDGDIKCANWAHVLRLPGTMNHKYTPPQMVTIEKLNAGLVHDLWEFGRDDAEEWSSHSYSGPTAGAAALALARARVADWPYAIEGDHGDDTTFKLACMLMRDLGLEEEDALELMLEWNERCVPPWSAADLRKKIRSAARYGKGEVGVEDPTFDFSGVENSVGADDIPKGTLEKLNAEFKAVDDSGQLRIYSKIRDESLDRYVWRRYSRTSFLEVGQSIRQLPLKNMGTQEKPKYMPMAEYWLDWWREKKTFNGMTMRPECNDERTPDNMLNMWHGFAVEEKRGNWDRVKELVRDILCKGDEDSYEYVMNWMARAVQIPWEPGKTALVFRGRKGAGKSTLGNLFWRLFGQHGLHITGREQFIGRFNSHLRDCIALFADEAFWAGDKQGESQLKAFITEHSLTFEQKGKDPEMGRNYLHVIMASNMDWVIPASVDERRFAVFEVSDEVRNADWWAPLHDNAELKFNILPAMLWELKRRNILKFNVFDIPQTEALAEQKVQTMDHVGAWLLKASESDWADFGQPYLGVWWPVEDVFASYARTAENDGVRIRKNEISLGISIRKYMPGGILQKRQIMQDGQRKYFYAFPEAEMCHDHIRKLLGIST